MTYGHGPWFSDVQPAQVGFPEFQCLCQVKRKRALPGRDHAEG